MRCKLCFLNLPICSLRGRPMNKNTSPGPSVDRGIRIVRLLKQVFQPYRVMFKDLKVNMRNSHYDVFAKKRKALKILKRCFLRRGRPIVALPGVSLEPDTKGKAKHVCIDTINAFLMVNINTKFCFLKCYVM